MTIINYTPDPILVPGRKTLEPSGRVAAVHWTLGEGPEIDGLPSFIPRDEEVVVKNDQGEIEPFPMYVGGTYYIVSPLVKTVLKYRHDVMTVINDEFFVTS